jgi:pachytene checkpoint protein 2
VSTSARTRLDTIRNIVHTHLLSSLERIGLPSVIDGWEDLPGLMNVVERISASESSCPHQSIPIDQAALQIYVYQPSDADPFEEPASTGGSAGRAADGEEVMAATVCELPSRGWEGLWESLIYPDDIKLKLLNYIYATVVFSDADVDCRSLWSL